VAENGSTNRNQRLETVVVVFLCDINQWSDPRSRGRCVRTVGWGLSVD
jgi:hypothetical protein